MDRLGPIPSPNDINTAEDAERYLKPYMWVEVAGPGSPEDEEGQENGDEDEENENENNDDEEKEEDSEEQEEDEEDNDDEEDNTDPEGHDPTGGASRSSDDEPVSVWRRAY